MPPPLLTSGKAPLTVISDGLGQDTAALVALALDDPAFRRRYVQGDLLIVSSDTGDEHAETSAYLERKKAALAERGVAFVHLTPDLGYHSPAWSSLYGQWTRNSTIQSLAFPRTCSSNLKPEPLYRFLNHHLAQRYGYVERQGRTSRAGLYGYAREHGPLRVMIGFSAGEERRVKPAQQAYLQDTVERLFPLIDLGLDRQGCQAATHALGHEVPYPSNCRSCPFASPRDVLRLYRREPDAFWRWAAAEERKLTHPKWAHTKNHTVFANGKTLVQTLDEAQKTFGHLSLEELDQHRMCRGHANTTAF